MLSIGKLGAGQERYYLDKVAEGAEDYYAGEGEASGEWAGELSRDLGLAGTVEADQLTAMLTGHHPAGGDPLLGRQGVPGRGAVPGFDLTFSAPKSVSLLWGLGGPVAAFEVNAAHREAIGAALDYLQREACWTRRGAGGKEFVRGEGYLAAAYRHRSSRNGDPQLHTHVLIANATRGPDGRWTRLYHPAIYEHATTASYIYEAHLRHELSARLGVRWQETRRGIAEIAGFAEEHLRAFSTRRAEILEAAGPDASARSMQVATLATRRAKDTGLTRGEMLAGWRRRAEEIGLGTERIERTFDPEARLRVADPDAAASTVSHAEIEQAVTASASHFDRRDAIRAVADSLSAGAPGAEVERMADAFLASGQVIRVAEARTSPRYTTRRIWELERGALAAAGRMKAAGPDPAGEVTAARVIAARPTLKADQREMVHRLLAERTGLSVVIGEAGTGKTYAIVAAAEGWAGAGIELRAAAPTWRAANVMRAEGLPATSVAALLAELGRAEQEGREGLGRGSVLLVDEAGMVDSANLARLVHHAEAAEAKLVLVGDPEQLSEIEAGGLFRELAERAEPVHLDEVIRHEHELDRVAAKRIREGEGREAIGLYGSAGRVTVAPDAEGRREAMVGDWHGAFESGEDAVMIAKRNVEVERLNAMAREARRRAGRLGDREIEVGGARFAAGDRVITRVNDQRNQIYNRERWQVVEVDPAGRSVLLRGVDQGRTVRLGADYLARTNPHSDAPALQHAYAMTSYSAQGTTVDSAFVMADPSMDKQELYVAASRARGETRLYATPEIQPHREEIAPRSAYLREGLPHIAEAAERDRAQLAAHAIAQLDALPTEELVGRRSELSIPAEEERRAEGRRESLEEDVEEIRERLRGLEARRPEVEERHAAEGGPDLGFHLTVEEDGREALARREARLGDLPPVGREARAELARIEAVLEGRRALAVTAAGISPPAYVTAELGERPDDPAMSREWDRGVVVIERYRQENGITDPGRAFGPEPKAGVERARREAAMRRLDRSRHALGRSPSRDRSRGIGRSIGRGP